MQKGSKSKTVLMWFFQNVLLPLTEEKKKIKVLLVKLQQQAKQENDSSLWLPLIKANPEDFETRLYYCVALVIEKKLDKALEELNIALALAKNNLGKSMTHFWFGELHKRNKDEPKEVEIIDIKSLSFSGLKDLKLEKSSLETNRDCFYVTPEQQTTSFNCSPNFHKCTQC